MQMKERREEGAEFMFFVPMPRPRIHGRMMTRAVGRASVLYYRDDDDDDDDDPCPPPPRSDREAGGEEGSVAAVVVAGHTP